MTAAVPSLMQVHDGWDGHQQALMSAMAPLAREQMVWRILSHDRHHGGQLALLLSLRGIDAPKLGDQGGHLTVAPLAEPA